MLIAAPQTYHPVNLNYIPRFAAAIQTCTAAGTFVNEFKIAIAVILGDIIVNEFEN